MRFRGAGAVIGFLLLNGLPLWLLRAWRRLKQRGWHRCAFLLSQMSTPLCIPRLYRAEIAAHFELCRLRETGRIEDAARLASRTAASGVFLADSINYVI